MRTLVFGKSGQVATELAGAKGVVCLDRAAANLADPEACAAAIIRMQPDAVINAAAYTAVDQAEDTQDIVHVVNGIAPGAMARACTTLDIPFVHISTDYVFDGSGSQPFATDAHTAPRNTYGRSKRVGELAVIEAGGRYCILRTSWVFSAHGQNFVKTMLRLSETHDVLDVVADQIGGPTPATAIADACLSIAESLVREPEDAGIYHFSSKPDTNWADFARAILASAKRDTRVRNIMTADYPTRAKRPFKAFPFIHEAYPEALKKFQHSSGVKRSQIWPMASMS